MKIAFVSGNRETLPDAVVPIGLLYIMSSVPAGHEKKLIDLCFADYSNISDTLDYYAALIGAAKSVSRAPIVIGGAGFSVMPSQLMGRLGADYGISGEGEEAFPALLRALEAPARRDAELALIGGLHWYRNGRLAANSRGPVFLDLNRLPAPDRSLVDPRYYALCGIESVQTTRGCPLRCDYCTYPLIEGRVGRVREPAKIVDEMFRAVEQHRNISHFFIVDSVFNLPRTHAKNVCRELVRRGWTM